MKALLRAMVWLKPYGLTALLAFLSMALVSAAQLATPQLIAWVIDLLEQWGGAGSDLPITELAVGALAILGLAVGRGMFTFTQNFLGEKLSQDVAYDIRNTIFSKLQNLSFSYHDRAQTGQLMTRVTSDVEQVRIFFGLALLQAAAAVALLVGSLVVLLVMDWLLALVTFSVIPFLLGILLFLLTRIRPMFGELQNRLGKLNTILQENLAGVRVVQAFAAEPREFARYDASNSDLRDQQIKLLNLFSSIFPLVFLFANLGTLLVIWVGGNRVIAGSLSLGQLVAFNTYLTLLLLPLFILGGIATLISRAAASADRIFEVIDAENEVHDLPDAKTLTDVTGRVEFDHVSFRYAGGDRDVLTDVTFTAEPGQTVAILGQTGSGKSSIINLIPRFYDPTKGTVRIDGHDLRTVTLDSLRQHIGIVLQESTLFTGSVRDNIAYGLPDAPLEDVIAAAQAAQAHDFITALPDGYDTLVGERGVNLSGGQKQRIAIARALLVNPRILILDDSTSAVDAETEYKLQQALDKLMVGRTSFVIAQRISTVRNADQILLLDGGKLVAHGTHEELLATSALYSEIIDSQFKDHEASIIVAAGDVLGEEQERPA